MVSCAAEVFYTQEQLYTFFFFSFNCLAFGRACRTGRAGFSPITLTFTAVNFQQRHRLPSSTSHPPFMKGGRRANYRQHSHVSRCWEATNLAVFRPSQHFFSFPDRSPDEKEKKKKKKVEKKRARCGFSGVHTKLQEPAFTLWES